ncbi:MAG: Re/Si-specific NAD(P)(+) transhydrogenase subunit alpha [Aliiglaciecola sp.]
MPNIAFPKEENTAEKRCSLLPMNVKAYKSMGAEVLVEAGLGNHLYISDEEYKAHGATIVENRTELLNKADLVLTLHRLPKRDLPHLANEPPILISFLDPFNEYQYVGELCDLGITGISMEMIPRISRCQKMDALSSQASLAGYVMVMKAVNYLQGVLPMMMTPSGTLKPAKVFVIGAGVAGLQAIATAKRLGASVTAFDTRSVVAEQVQSLGAKFLEIDLGETGETQQGYAQALTPAQLEKQQKEQAKCIIESDIVITTAQLFGRKPPLLIDADVVSQMKPGSVIVDMAAQNGGNVAGSEGGKTVEKNGVTIIGKGDWAAGVAKHASQMYANNLFNLVSEFWDKERNLFDININDEIQSGCVITHQKEVVNKTIKEYYASFDQLNKTAGAA